MKRNGLVILIIVFVVALVSILISANHKDSKNYTLDVYTDTIYDYIIVTTVANNGNNIGVSSIIVNDIYDFSNNN